MIYDNTTEHPNSEDVVRDRLTELGYPEELQTTAVMHGTDIARFLPTPDDPDGWETQELDEGLVELLLEKVKLNAEKHAADWIDPEIRKQVYEHLFLRDWERLAASHAGGEQWWHKWRKITGV